MTMELTGRLRASAPVHVHVDPFIGGGAGTTIGIEANSDAAISLTARVRTVESQGGRFVIVEATPGCQTIKADVASDGKLKADFGWTAVPKIGARMHVPVGRERLAPSLLLDTRPHFVALPIKDPDGESGPWQVRPAWGGAIFRLSDVEGRMDDAGLYARAAFRIEGVGRGGDQAAVQAGMLKTEKESQVLLAEWERLSDQLQDEDIGCDAKSTIEVLLGDIAIGPNNEVVKFLRNAWNDLTRRPGDNNEVVRAGQKIAEVLNVLSLHDEAARKLTREITEASAKVFGENSPVTKTFASVDKEVNKATNDPARAAFDAPRNVARETKKGAENVAREGKKGVDNVKREVSKGIKKLFR